MNVHEKVHWLCELRLGSASGLSLVQYLLGILSTLAFCWVSTNLGHHTSVAVQNYVFDITKGE